MNGVICLNLPFDSFPDGPLVFDASVLFNLLGTDEAEEILICLGVPCLVEKRTRNEVRRHPRRDVNIADPLQPYITAGLLQVCEMSDTAYDAYLSLVQGQSEASLGDGESAAIALAVDTQSSVLLDDRKARSIHSNRFPRTPMASSLALLVHAARCGRWPASRLQSVVTRARAHARMSIVAAERALLQQICGPK